MGRFWWLMVALPFVACGNNCQETARVISSNGKAWAETCASDQTIEVKPVEAGVLVTCRCGPKRN